MNLPLLQFNNQVFVAAPLSLTQVSSVLDISGCVGFCVHAFYTGAPVGSLIVETSADGINFIPVDTTAISVAGARKFSADRDHSPYMRVRYVFTSGTGSINCHVSAKRG